MILPRALVFQYCKQVLIVLNDIDLKYSRGCRLVMIYSCWPRKMRLTTLKSLCLLLVILTPISAGPIFYSFAVADIGVSGAESTQQNPYSPASAQAQACDPALPVPFSCANSSVSASAGYLQVNATYNAPYGGGWGAASFYDELTILNAPGTLDITVDASWYRGSVDVTLGGCSYSGAGTQGVFSYECQISFMAGQAIPLSASISSTEASFAITHISVYDSQGNLMPVVDYSTLSQCSYDVDGGANVNASPEPATWVLIAAAPLIVLWNFLSRFCPKQAFHTSRP